MIENLLFLSLCAILLIRSQLALCSRDLRAGKDNLMCIRSENLSLEFSGFDVVSSEQNFQFLEYSSYIRMSALVLEGLHLSRTPLTPRMQLLHLLLLHLSGQEGFSLCIG